MRIILLVAIVASFGLHQASQAAASERPLFRSTGPEVRLRCGSTLLRAKLRGGRLLVQTEDGSRVTLSKVAEPRAVPNSPAYGDGRLTLYKLSDAPIWALERVDRPGEPAQHCTLQRRLP